MLRKRLWTDARAVGTLLNEAGVAQRLEHPHIVPLLGVGRFERGTPYLVFDWIEGRDLHSIVAHEALPIMRAIDYTLSASEALQAAHAAGILHCDVKPANLLLDRDGRLFLTDFGFGRIAAAMPLASAGGTPAFCAPEQLSDAFGEITQRTDVYGLAATLYAILTGAPPFSGRDAADVIAQVLSLTPCPAASRLRRDIPRALDRVIDRALQKEPGDRYVSISEFAAALREAAG